MTEPMDAVRLPARERMREAVERYLAAVAAGTAEEIAALYTPEGTLEDPAGSQPVRGRAAIADFYRPISGLERRTRLREFRAAGDTAAFGFEVDVVLPGRVITTSPIDVMTFDAEGLIVSMRAVWSDDDVRTAADEQNGETK